MPNKALLDTDILSEIAKGIDPIVAARGTAYRRTFRRYTTSAVTVMEIVRGFQRINASRRLQLFVALTAGLEVLSFDQPAAELAGRIASDLERVGLPIGPADSMIAAVALTRGLELVTGDTAHFQRVQDLGHPLALTNWRV